MKFFKIDLDNCRIYFATIEQATEYVNMYYHIHGIVVGIEEIS